MRKLCSIGATCSIGLWSLASLAQESPRGPSPAEQERPLADAVRPPRPLQELTAAYPHSETREASVLLECVISPAGEVTELTVLEGAEPFASRAIAAAEQWRFAPAVARGEPVAARIRVQLRFIPPPTTAPATPPERAQSSTPEPVRLDAPVEVTVVGELHATRAALGRAEVRQMPGALGDPFRAVEALPGVTPIASGLPYFFVRGAPPGNVGYFFDEVGIPLLYHGAGGPGVIHPAFIESVTLYPAAYPAKYGRSVGGVLDGKLAEPRRTLRAQTSVRLLDAGGFIEVPFAEDRGNVMVGGRYSYAGLLVSALSPEIDVAYWDYQAAGSYAIGGAGEFSILAFGSHDYVADTSGPNGPVELLDLTFHRARVKYETALTNETDLTASVIGGLSRTAGRERPDDGTPVGTTDVHGQLLGFQARVEHQLTQRVRLQVGADTLLSRTRQAHDPAMEVASPASEAPHSEGESGNIRPGPWPDERREGTTEVDPIDPSDRLPDASFPPDAKDVFDFESRIDSFVRSQFTPRSDVFSGAWVTLEWQPTSNISVIPALRFDSFLSGDTWAYGIDPRINLRYRISDRLALVHAFGVAHQPASFALPIVGLNPPPSRRLQRAVQSSAGAEFTLANKVFASITGYQNVTLNSSDVLGASRFATASDEIDPLADRTTAHGYGLEFLVRRSFGESFAAWCTYTLSRSTRSTAYVSGTSSFDRTHVVNLAAAYDLGRNWRLGGRLVAYSGIPAAVGTTAALSAPPRTSWFHRLDWRLEKRWALGARGRWLAVVAEVVNTTLNKEALNANCYAYGCREQEFGPVTLPSLGLEASL